MKERLNFRQLIAVASMLFGLFFGAGNLIFPVHMGQLAGANSYIAALGFIVTAVGLPLIGVAAFGISRSDDLLRHEQPRREGVRRILYLRAVSDDRPAFCDPPLRRDELYHRRGADAHPAAR